MTEKHTPGPWEYRKQYYAYEQSAIWHGSDWVCSFGLEYESAGNLDDGGPVDPCAGTPPNDADARLMAAAPDLLAALQAIVDADIFEIGYDLDAPARAAITKALGTGVGRKDQ